MGRFVRKSNGCASCCNCPSRSGIPTVIVQICFVHGQHGIHGHLAESKTALKASRMFGKGVVYLVYFFARVWGRTGCESSSLRACHVCNYRNRNSSTMLTSVKLLPFLSNCPEDRSSLRNSISFKVLLTFSPHFGFLWGIESKRTKSPLKKNLAIFIISESFIPCLFP